MLLTAFLLKLAGGEASILLTALGIGVGAIILASGNRKAPKSIILPSVATGIALVLALAQMATHAIGPVPVGDDPVKDLYRLSTDADKGGQVIESRWSLFGRTDLVRHPQDPEEMNLFVDGTAGTPIYHFTGDPANPGPKAEAMKTGFPGYFPFLTLADSRKDHILIIGPGGGRDILAALMGGFKAITAVEVNPQVVDMVKEQGHYSGGVYSRFPNVSIVVDEGRNFLRRSSGPFDMILLTLPVTKSSRSVEGYALTESFLLTTEAVHDYWSRLSPEGQIAVVVHNNSMVLRLASVFVKALEKEGIAQDQAMRHIYMVGWGTNPLVVMRKTPFAPEETEALKTTLAGTGYSALPSFFPYEGSRSDDSILKALNLVAAGRVTMAKVVDASSADVSAVTDDSPFFYKFEKGLPPEVFTLLLIAIAGTAATAAFPLTFARAKSSGGRARGIFIFALLGFSFMAAEVALIQKLMLFLGQPTVTLGVVLVALLAGMSAGSWWSGSRSPETASARFRINAVAAGLLLAGYLLALPLLNNTMLGLALPLRAAAAFIVLLPAGFFAGQLFPAGMSAYGNNGHAASLWAVNGAASVLGSVAAVALAINIGFSFALLVAGCGYLVTAVMGIDIIGQSDSATVTDRGQTKQNREDKPKRKK